MKFLSISFQNFRNIKDTTISVDANTIYLIGNNAQGKTNTLEAIYILAYGSSFRTRLLDQICSHGCNSFSLVGEIADSHSLSHTISFRWKDGQRIIHINDHRITDRKELLALLPCIVFSHEDYRYVNGGPDYRRKFFDQTQCLRDQLYADTLHKYNRILKLRNRALKERQLELLDTYDLQLVEEGLKIVKTRQGLATFFEERLTKLFQTIVKEELPLALQYTPSWGEEGESSAILKQLKARRPRDVEITATSAGPHRDTITFIINGHNAAATASTGQIRLLSLLLKILQAELVIKVSTTYPILLIDDVLLELDHTTRRALRAAMPTAGQEFYTFLQGEEHNTLDNQEQIVYQVEDGILLGNSARRGDTSTPLKRDPPG